MTEQMLSPQILLAIVLMPLAAAMAAAEAQALGAVGRSAAEGGFATPVEFSNV